MKLIFLICCGIVVSSIVTKAQIVSIPYKDDIKVPVVEFHRCCSLKGAANS